MSIPKAYANVKRYSRVNIEYLDRDFQPKRAKLKEMDAVISQHEFDHLQGILFIDRMEFPEDAITRHEYHSNGKLDHFNLKGNFKTHLQQIMKGEVDTHYDTILSDGGFKTKSYDPGDYRSTRGIYNDQLGY